MLLCHNQHCHLLIITNVNITDYHHCHHCHHCCWKKGTLTVFFVFSGFLSFVHHQLKESESQRPRQSFLHHQVNLSMGINQWANNLSMIIEFKALMLIQIYINACHFTIWMQQKITLLALFVTGKMWLVRYKHCNPNAIARFCHHHWLLANTYPAQVTRTTNKHQSTFSENYKQLLHMCICQLDVCISWL